jgi:hypothetical protein
VQLSYSNLPVIVLWIYKMGGNFPEQIQKVLEMKRFIATGRNIGIDCGKLEDTFGIVVPSPLELRHLALADRPELGDLSDGTRLVKSCCRIIYASEDAGSEVSWTKR